MFTQDVLHAELARRVRAALAGPNAAPEDVLAVPSLDELAAQEREAPDMAAIAVLRRFDPAVFARSSVEFALGVGETARACWLRAFTRTLFLAGTPVNLSARFPFDHVAPDGSVAWLGPASRGSSTGLRRLLKRFDGDVAAVAPATVEFTVPGPRGGTTLYCHVATAGVSLSDYLVHVNHVLAEAVLIGAIRPGHRVVLKHAPRLAVAGPYSVLRVHRDGADSTRLRAYAGLSARPLRFPSR
jgi:hypothetical protein